MMNTRLIAASVLAAAGAALAGPDLYLGSANSTLLVGSPTAGGFTQVGLGGADISAITPFGPDLMLGDSLGNIFRFDVSAGTVVKCLGVPEPVAALATHNGVLLAGSPDGTVYHLDPQTSQIISTRQLPMGDIAAMHVVDDTLFVGGHSTFVFKGGAASGSFAVLTVCGGQVDSMTTGSGELLLGTVQGRVYRINAVTGAYYGIIQNPEGQVAMVMDGSTLVTAAADGTIRRVVQVSGAVSASFEAGVPITAMAILDGGCAPDFNADGVLNLADFGAFQTAYALGDPRADYNGDGVLNLVDFGAFQTGFATGCR